jgi:hypothetical protein
LGRPGVTQNVPFPGPPDIAGTALVRGFRVSNVTLIEPRRFYCSIEQQLIKTVFASAQTCALAVWRRFLVQ